MNADGMNVLLGCAGHNTRLILILWDSCTVFFVGHSVAIHTVSR